MCQLAREQAAQASDGPNAEERPPLPRQRWIAAGALALAGGIAFAAWWTPDPTVAVVQEPPRAAAITVSTQSPPTPAEPVVVERIMIGVPDGIPVPPEMSAARGSYSCSESL